MGWQARHREGQFGLVRPDGQAARRPQKVVVGYPVGGSVTLPFHKSMIQLIAYELAKGDDRLLGGTLHVSSLYVADNRTLITQQFLERSTADWLLQIDTDIAFPPTLLETLVALAGSDKKIFAASVPLGEYASCAFRRDPAKPGLYEAVWPVPLTPIEVDGIATACVLIHRDVFEALADRNGQSWFHHIYLPESTPETPPRQFKFRSQGEDLAFSVRAREAGFSIWCAHVAGLRHFKTKGLSHDDDRAVAMAQAAAAGDDGMGEIVNEDGPPVQPFHVYQDAVPGAKVHTDRQEG